MKHVMLLIFSSCISICMQKFVKPSEIIGCIFAVPLKIRINAEQSAFKYPVKRYAEPDVPCLINQACITIWLCIIFRYYFLIIRENSHHCFFLSIFIILIRFKSLLLLLNRNFKDIFRRTLYLYNVCYLVGFSSLLTSSFKALRSICSFVFTDSIIIDDSFIFIDSNIFESIVITLLTP